MTMLDERSRSTDEIVGALSPHVWALLQARYVDAAVALLRANVAEFLDAQRKETGAVVEPWERIVLEADPQLVVKSDERPKSVPLVVDVPTTKLNLLVRSPKGLVRIPAPALGK